MTSQGIPLSGEPENESDHFEVCPECGVAFDMRDLNQVMQHVEPGHEKPVMD
jgi:hypothetical protein